MISRKILSGRKILESLHWCLCNTEWKSEKFTLNEKIFRQIVSLAISLEKLNVGFTNFLQKSVRVILEISTLRRKYYIVLNNVLKAVQFSVKMTLTFRFSVSLITSPTVSLLCDLNFLMAASTSSSLEDEVV